MQNHNFYIFYEISIDVERAQSKHNTDNIPTKKKNFSLYSVIDFHQVFSENIVNEIIICQL